MREINQGDIIRLDAQRKCYIVVSKNAFIRTMRMLYVCPMIEAYVEGPTHVNLCSINGIKGTALCENIKLIDPIEHGIFKIDSIRYGDIMEISDIIQGLFEYD